MRDGGFLRTGARRWLRGAVLAIVPLVAVYEIAMNAFLMTGALGRTLSFDPETFTVRYRSAWSILPGYIHARDLYIRSKDSHVEFELRIDHCTFQAALFDLLKRRFHATSVRGEGVVFRARQRIAADQENPRTLAALPPIEGLEEIPRQGPVSPPPDDAHYKLWSAQLDHVDARSVREIWVDQLRFVGDAQVVGGFSLKPIRWVTVGPASVSIRTGRVMRGEDAIADPVTGTADVTIDGFAPRAVEGAAIFRFINVRTALRAEIPRLDFVDGLLDRPLDEPKRLFRGSGQARCDLIVQQGRLSAPTHVEIVADPLAIELEQRTVEGKLRALADVAGVNGVDALDAVVEVRDARLIERGFDGAPSSAERAELRLHSKKLDLADHPFVDATASFSLPSVQIPDARVVSAWSQGTGARVTGGRGTCGAHIDAADGVARGNLVLGLDRLRIVQQDGWSVTGNVRMQVALRSWNIARGAMDLSGSHIELSDLSTTGGTAAWWARVDLPSVGVELHPKPSFRAHVALTARDARPLASLFAAKSNVPDWLVPLFSTDDLRGSADLRAWPASAEVRDLTATAGGFRVEAGWGKHGPATHTLLLVELGPLAVAMEGRDGDTRLQLLGAESWYREHVAANPIGR